MARGLMTPSKRLNPLQWGFDSEPILRLCIDKKVCCISFKSRRTHGIDIHHVDTVGMGNDRTTFDDSKCRKMALTREYHQEYHAIGGEAFEKKYKVYGVIHQTDELDPMEGV